VKFSQVVMEVMRQIEGAYALIFKSSHYPNELVACKCGSPLLLGVKVMHANKHMNNFFFFFPIIAISCKPRSFFPVFC
jgi:glucosamine--fructose-6-phosphate aminotransferase (isomerizing)